MSFDKPIENIIQYTDKKGINYVASSPRDMDLEPWFDQMIESYGLFQLAKMFPYITLVLNTETGLLEPCQPVRYNAKVTNGFHLMLAKERDENPEKYATEFKLHLEDAFPDHDEPEVRDVEFPGIDKFLLREEDGFGIDNEKLPESVSFKPIKNWHPNRDANGNYMTGSYYNPYGPMGYQSGYQNPYAMNTPSYLPSYLPSYQSQYPF